MRIPLSIYLLIATISASALAATPKANVRLEAEVASAAPGQRFDIALVFDIQPSWHLYWKNPGETGLPPSAAWTLPEGVTVTDLRFPTPTRIKSAEGVVSFGYENQLVLIATVALPAGFSGELVLAGQVDWLVCHDVCLSESAPVKLASPVGMSKPAKDAKQFDAWRAALPNEGKLSTSFTVDVASKRGEMSVILPADASTADLFPPAANFAVYGEPKIETVDAGTSSERKKISVPFRVLPSELSPVRDYGICTYVTPAGRQQFLVLVDYRPNP